MFFNYEKVDTNIKSHTTDIGNIIDNFDKFLRVIISSLQSL